MIIDTLRNMLPRDGRTGLLARAFALAMLFAAVLSVALALQSGSPVEAQSAGTLVSNTGQTGTTDGSVSLDHAQAFTTGPSSTGYKLTRVEVDFSVDTGTQVGYAMEIWSDSSGSPGSLLHTLNKPGTLSVGTNNFAASGGIDLDANATYHVVYNVDDTGGAAKIRYTDSDDEDSGAAVGWSIANGGRYRTYSSSGGWTNYQHSLKIAIVGQGDGTAPTLGSASVNGRTLKLNYNEALDRGSVPATTDFTVSVAGTDQTPTRVAVSGQTVTLTLGTAATAGQAVTVTYTVGTNPIRDLVGNDAAALTTRAVTNATGATTLVSNTGQTAGADKDFVRDYAQAFTTGSNSPGYTLTSVQLNLKSTGTTGTKTAYAVHIYADSSGVPTGARLGTLATTTTPTRNFSLVQFDDTSGNGISLDANRTYWVVTDVDTVGDITIEARTTNSDAEDSGAAIDWSIANTHRSREVVETDWGTTTTNSALHLRVNGSAKGPPPPTLALSPTLVSNSGRTSNSDVSGFGKDKAQAFTTGSHSSGYKLTSVQIQFAQSGTPPDFRVKIMNAGGSGPGATTVGTLADVDTIAVGLNTFTGSVNLDPNTTYYMVIDLAVAAPGSTAGLGLTDSNGEDPGAAAGWSIGNTLYQRTDADNSTPWAADTSNLGFLKFRVNGYAKLNVPVPGLRQSSDNDGYDRCATIVVEWNDPTDPTEFTGYKVVVTHHDGTTTTLTADNITTTVYNPNTGQSEVTTTANTGAIVLVRQPSATHSQTYKIDVQAYHGTTGVGETMSRTVTVPACVPPGPPRSLRITENGPSSIELTWTAPSNAATVGVHEYVLEQLRDGFTDWDTEAEHISTLRADSDSFRFTAPSMRAGDTRQYRLSAVRYVGFPTHAYPEYPYPVDTLDHTLRIRSNPSNTVSMTHLTAPASPWLTAETDGDGVALLTWSAPTEDGGTPVTSYQLQRSKVAGETMPDPEDDSGWTNLSVPSSGQYRHTGLTAGDTWHYRMRARNSSRDDNDGWSSWFYAQVTIPEGGLPKAPRLTTSSTGTAVDLSWTEPTDIGTTNADGTPKNARADCNNGSSWTASDRGNFICYYELRMQEDGGGWSTSSTTTALCATPDGLRTCEVVRDQRNSHRPTLLRITIDERSHEYQRLNPGASYQFRVRAVTALVDESESRFGAWSNVGTVRVPSGPTIESDVTGEVIPVTPNEPTISFTEKANNAGSDATIRWSRPDGYTGSVSYRLQWENPATGQWQTLTNTSATSYTHRNLSPSTRYAYRVAVRYGSGVGPYSYSGSGISPGIAFPPDAPTGVRVTSINTTGFNVAWNRSPSASTYTPATTRYVYGLCERVKEKRTIILDPNKGPEEVEVNVTRCDASQSTTGTTGRITTDPGEKIFGVAAVNARGQSDWTTAFVSVPDAAATRLTVSRTSLSLTEGDYDRGGSYTVTLVNGDEGEDYQLLIDSSWDKNALVTKECNIDKCMLKSDESHTVTVTAYAMWDEDRNDGGVVFHHEIEGVVSGPSVRVTVRDKVNEPPVISCDPTSFSIAENSTGVLGTCTFTDKEDDIWRLGILPDSDLYQRISFRAHDEGYDLRLASPLDYEKGTTYEIKLYARDRFNTTIHTVTVTVTDVDEN